MCFRPPSLSLSTLLLSSIFSLYSSLGRERGGGRGFPLSLVVVHSKLRNITLVATKVHVIYRNIIAGSPPCERIFFLNKVCLSKTEFLNLHFLAKNNQ
jgi:hypothetical protein